MFSKITVLWPLIMTFSSLCGVSANFEQEKHYISHVMLPAMQECSSQLGVSLEDVHKAKRFGNADNIDLPCFYTCVFKKLHLFNNKGMFDLNKTLETIKKFFNSSGHSKALKEVAKICSKVNQQAVIDGKGCERAVLILKCFEERKGWAMNDAQKAMIQAKFLSGGVDCIKDHPLSMEDIKAFRSKMIPDGENAKCFAACLFKKIGVMDDMGKLTQSNAMEKAKEVFGNDEEHMKKVDQFITKCASVNGQNVNDGDKGCDRAKLAFQCLAENAPKFGFNVDF